MNNRLKPLNKKPRRRKPVPGSKALLPGSASSLRSKIRQVGNSSGIILSNQLLQKAGLSHHADVMLTAQDGQIIIMELKEKNEVNTDLSSWEQEFKKAIKKGRKPEKDLFDNISNEFDQNEW